MALISNNISGSSSDNSKIGITGSVIFSNEPGSSFPAAPAGVTFFVSGTTSTIGADRPSILFKGDTFHSSAFGVNNYIQMKPVGPVILPTNTTASYIYTSGSTNDLYFTQYVGQFTNTTRLRWLESTLSTGLLHGGVLSTQAGTTTFSIRSGSALIVAPNASTSDDPYPTVKYLEWPSYVSQSLTYVTSSQITYIGINQLGGIIQQTTPFTNGDFLDYIQLGRILHLSGSVTTAAVSAPSTSYSVPQQTSHFTRAFGPLKISGHVLAASGSTLSLTKTAGDSYAEGRNYTVDPDDPNYIRATSDTAVTVSKIYREYVSGSTIIIDTGIANAGFTVVDPTKYNNNGTLGNVSAGQYTIQRVYWFPNSVDRAFYVYYGNAVYNTLDAAEAAIPTEVFTEGTNTKTGAIYVAAVLIKGNASNLSDTAQARFVQGGLFRSITSTGGGGAAATTPGGLDTYVQFNDGGSTFGGDADFTYNKTTNIATIGDVSIGDTGLISTSGVTATIFNTNATTVNFAGAASTILNMGNSSGQTRISGSVKMPQGLSGSLTQLTDGTSYLIAGDYITITTGSSGAVTITGQAPGAPTSARYLLVGGGGGTAQLTDERTFTPGTGLTATDGGANGNYTLAINDSVVATVSGTTFTGNVRVTGSLGSSTLTVVSGVLYQGNGIIQQDSSFVWDADNNRLGINTATPARSLHIGTSPAFRLGTTDYVEVTQASAAIYRWSTGGATTTVEHNPNLIFRANTTLGFNASNGSTTDAGFSRAATGIINVSGSAPGAVLRFNASSTPLAAGDLGMNTVSGRPNAFIGGVVQQLAHINEIAPITASYVVLGLDGTLTNERVLTAGTGLSLTDGGANGNATLAINNGVVATISGSRFTGDVISATDIIASGTFKSMNSINDEGGELFLNKAVTNTTLNTGVTIDVYQNRLRIFETGGTNRGGYYDVSTLGAGVTTNLAAGATPGGSDTYVQFNDGGSTFGGDAGLTYNKTTDTLTITGDLDVNGGDITTTASTFNLLQSASILNVGTTGLARTINVATPTTTIQTVNIGNRVDGSNINLYSSGTLGVGIKTHTGYTGSDMRTITGAVTTTGNTTTTIASISGSAGGPGTTYWVEGTFVGHNAVNTFGMAVRHACFYVNNAGNAMNQQGSTNNTVSIGQFPGTWTANLSTSGTNIIATVTGQAGTTIDWSVTLKYQAVSGSA